MTSAGSSPPVHCPRSREQCWLNARRPSAAAHARAPGGHVDCLETRGRSGEGHQLRHGPCPRHGHVDARSAGSGAGSQGQYGTGPGSGPGTGEIETRTSSAARPPRMANRDGAGIFIRRSS